MSPLHRDESVIGTRDYRRKMDMAQLEAFVVEAKSHTYAGAGEPARPCRSGSHDLTFQREAWSYRDSYFGGTDFLGQEVVWLRREPVWAMNYYGWICAPGSITAAEAGAVIKVALSSLYTQGRFLGGWTAVINDWTYEDGSTGTVGHFEGREVIRHSNGDEVYALTYHGGLVRA